MDYEKHYNLLIERAKNRFLEGYSERHHIIPKCMGGNDSKDNSYRLTEEYKRIHSERMKKVWATRKLKNNNEEI